MIFYMIRYEDHSKDKPVSMKAWAGTQTLARKLQKDLEAKHGKYNADDFVAFDVPTAKAELLEFLNKHATLEGDGL